VRIFPRRLWWFTVPLLAFAAAAATAAAAVEGAPPLVPVVVFASLLIFSEHRPVRLPNGISGTGGSLVLFSAIVVLVAQGSVLGAFLVGCANGLYALHFHRSAWPWIPFNAAVAALSTLGAALVYAAMPPSLTEHLPAAAVVAVAVALVFFAVNALLLAVSDAFEGQLDWRGFLRDVAPVVLQMVPFAILGFLLGRLYLDLGAAVMVLIIVPILIAREMFASYLTVKESHDETVHMLIRALETKDRYTAGHSERVATYAQYMGEEFAFRPARMERLRFAALMHDIGKLVVPNHLLNKPGRLTEEEFARIRLHEKVSVQMLSHIEFLRPIAAVTNSDAMRFDPDDEDHPVEPYMVMIADAYDAMTSTRSYRKAVLQEVAFQELRDKSGTQFHPACVEALINAIEKRGEMHGAGFEIHTEFDNAPDVGLGSAGLGDLLRTEIAS